MHSVCREWKRNIGYDNFTSEWRFFQNPVENIKGTVACFIPGINVNKE